MGEPPSDLGAGHSKSTWSLSQSITSGLPGAPGSSNKYRWFVTTNCRTLYSVQFINKFSGSEFKVFMLFKSVKLHNSTGTNKLKQ